MKLKEAYKKHIRYVIDYVEKNTPLYWENGSFVYNLYGDVDKDTIEDIIDDAACAIEEALDNKTGIMFESDVVANFIKKEKVINFVKN